MRYGQTNARLYKRTLYIKDLRAGTSKKSIRRQTRRLQIHPCLNYWNNPDNNDTFTNKNV